MEEYRNKVINLHANQSQNISKFTSEIYPEGHPKVKGGGHGGALPLRSLLAAVFAPPDRGCHGLSGQLRATGIRDPPSRTPLGAMGAVGTRAQGPWPPMFFHVIILRDYRFFFEIRPIEEVQGSNSSPRREEVGRRTLRVVGGFLATFFYQDRFGFFTQ